MWFFYIIDNCYFFVNVIIWTSTKLYMYKKDGGEGIDAT